MSPNLLTSSKSRVAVFGLAACLSVGLPALALAAEPDDSAPKLISTTGGERRDWPTRAALKKAADSGDPKACLQYGDALLRGDGMAKDTVQAIRYLRRAADQGEPNAAFRLGKIYDDGEQAPKDFSKAFSYYTDAAKAGVSEAQYNLGAMYVSARGVPRDYIEGLAWIIVATKNGASAEGEKQVRERLQKSNRQQQIAAAEQRASDILNDVAAALTGTSGTAPAPATQAPARIEIAGSSPEKVSLALPAAGMPDLSKTLEDRLRAAREKSPPVRLVTPRQTIKNWPTLIDLRAEADKKIPDALWALGKVYLDGTLVAADAIRALQLFEEAAARGNADAAYQLGEMYSKDTYVPHDDAKVFTYFQQAALGKVRPGFYNLGVCYVNGRGTPKDVTEGLAWLILAKKHDVDPRTEGTLRIKLQESDPSKIPLAEKRAAQLQKELFSSEP